jgi:hypothetical protein
MLVAHGGVGLGFVECIGDLSHDMMIEKLPLEIVGEASCECAAAASILTRDRNGANRRHLKVENPLLKWCNAHPDIPEVD